MSKGRYIALDAMRGLTLALMIVVNTPGSWSAVYAPLLHADWHGWTFTDLVFPFFLFIVGAALFFSRQASAQPTRFEQCKKITRRAFMLVALGVFLEFYPFLTNLESLRLPGVLQRIGLAYVLAAYMQVFFRPQWNLVLIAAILASYSALLLCASDPYGLEGNILRAFDLAVLGESHLWAGKGLAFDPENLLGTVAATATVLIGFEAARWLRSGQSFWRLVLGLVVVGICSVVVAYSLPEPINKSLWTSAYVLLTGGLALLFLAGLLVLERGRLGAWVMQPFSILGQNPLFIYALSWLWVRSYSLVATEDGTLYDSLFLYLALAMPAKLASLVFALLHLGLLWLLAWWLHSRKIYIKL